MKLLREALEQILFNIMRVHFDKWIPTFHRFLKRCATLNCYTIFRRPDSSLSSNSDRLMLIKFIKNCPNEEARSESVWVKFFNFRRWNLAFTSKRLSQKSQKFSVKTFDHLLKRSFFDEMIANSEEQEIWKKITIIKFTASIRTIRPMIMHFWSFVSEDSRGPLKQASF